MVGFTDYENDACVNDFQTLLQWKESRSIANSILVFLLVPVQENDFGELPPPYYVGTIPSSGSYTSNDIEFWTKNTFRYAKINELKIIGVAADNYSSHQSLFTSWYFSNEPRFSFIPASHTLIFEKECVPFHDSAHLIRNWLYNLNNLAKVMKLGSWPVLFEDLIVLNQYYPFDKTFLDVTRKMDQRAAEFFFHKTTIDALISYVPHFTFGLQLYLYYGSKLWRLFMDRNIIMSERLFIAGEIISFLIIWWNTVKEFEDSKLLILTRNTMVASIQACFSVYILNYLFQGKEIPVCPWRINSQP